MKLNIAKQKMSDTGKKALLWGITLIVLATSIGGSIMTVYATEVVGVRDAESYIKQAAIAQLVAQKFQYCAGIASSGLKDKIDPGFTGYTSAKLNGNGDSLYGGALQFEVATGSWLENATQGKFQNGTIYCNQGLFAKFRDTFKLTNAEIICDKFTKDSNGAMRSGGLFTKAPETDCQTLDGNNYYARWDYDGAAYVGRLYEDAMKDNPYAKSWANIGTFDKATGYFLYKQDFETACATGTYIESAGNSTVFGKKVKIVNEKGEIEELYAKARTGKNDSSDSGTSFAASGPTTCSGLIDKINEYAADYQKALLDAIKAECGSDEAKAKVEEYIQKYEEAEELTDEEQAELDKMKAARDSGDFTQATSKGGLECVEFKELIISPTPTDDGSGTNPVNQEDVEEEMCYQNAKSLGWVICPIIYGLRDMMENFYTAIEPLLSTNSSIVQQLGDSSQGLYTAWATFRNMANIVFVVLFLVVIFSQLTGYGIDNYGIKKMLPKLIITAITINLSFIICAIAVDISNIVGSGIKTMLENIGSSAGSIALDGNTATGSATAMGIFAQKAVGFIAAAGSTAVIAGVAFALEGWAMIIPILLFLLTVVISVFFALVVLGLRQALVVILIVISPLAFACNVLPNTEGIFKKWWSTAKGILMVYPIIGAVIGAGYLTASILMSADEGFIMTLVSGILMVAPYFMIPSLTRKALDAIGGLGTRVGNIGRNAGQGAKNRINSTDAVRNAKADSAAQRAQARAARYMQSGRARKVEEDMKNGKKVSLRRANQYARKAALANSRQNATISARSAQSQYNRLQGAGFDAAMSAATMSEDATTTKNWETMLSAGDYAYETEKLDANGNVMRDENGNAIMESHKVDSQSNDQIAKALEHELMQTNDKYDANKVRALSNALAAKGKEGRNLMYGAVSRAQSGDASAKAIKDFSSNIMNNHAGTMKEKHRSLYEFAKSTAGATLDNNGNVVAQYDDNGKLAKGYEAKSDGSFALSNISTFATSGVGSLTASDMTNMDIQQLERFVGKDENGDFNGSFATTLNKAEDQKQIAQLATDALHDEHLAQGLSGKTKEALENIVSAYNATGAPALTPSVGGASGGSISIDHSHDTASAAQLITENVEAKFKEGRSTGDIRLPDPGRAPEPKNGSSSIIDPKTGKPFGA